MVRKMGNLNKIMVISAMAVFIAISVTFVMAGPISDKGQQNIADTKEKILEKLSEKNIDRFNSNEAIRVIVTLKDEATDDKVLELEKKYDMRINSKGWKKTYPNGFAATTIKKKLLEMLADPNVVSIYEDEVVTTMLDTANSWSGVSRARDVTTGFGVDGDRDGALHSYSKNDVVVAIVDTGIDTNHVDLTGVDNGGIEKVIGWYDRINSRTTPYDDNGHGTHVASIAAGEGDANPNYMGVAPGAALVGVKVLDGSGSGYLSWVIDGVNWVVDHKNDYNIRIMSLSLGSSGSSDGTDPLSSAINNAVNQGILVTVAAGNSGPKKYTIGSPAAAKEALTVGAMADPGLALTSSGQMSLGDNGFYMAYFSSRGPTKDGRTKPDIVAPGVEIMAAQFQTTSSYTEKSGTSMATPFIAGVAALMLDAKPTLTPTEIKDIIKSTNVSEDWAKDGADIDYGYGRIKAYRAVERAATGANIGIDQETPKHDRFAGSLSSRTARYKDYTVTITDPTKPIAGTLIMTDWNGYNIDLDLYIYKNGITKASSAGIARQDTISYAPEGTGTYTVRVYRYSGSGPYTLDISYK